MQRAMMHVPNKCVPGLDCNAKIRSLQLQEYVMKSRQLLALNNLKSAILQKRLTLIKDRSMGRT